MSGDVFRTHNYLDKFLHEIISKAGYVTLLSMCTFMILRLWHEITSIEGKPLTLAPQNENKNNKIENGHFLLPKIMKTVTYPLLMNYYKERPRVVFGMCSIREFYEILLFMIHSNGYIVVIVRFYFNVCIIVT